MPVRLGIFNLTDSFTLFVLGRLEINRRIFWGPLYFSDIFSCSAVAIKLATPFDLLLVLEIFQPFHSFHSFHPYTHPTFAALKRLLHLTSFLYVSCRLLISSLTLTNSHSAFLSTTHTTLRCRSLARSRHPRGQTALHRPAPSRARAGLGLRGLSLSGSWPTRSTGTLASLHRPAPSRARAGLGLRGLSLSGSGRLGAPVPSRLMPTRNPPRSHPCSARADSDCRRLFTLG